MMVITNDQITSSKQNPISEAPITKHEFDLENRTLAFAADVIRFCKTVRQDAITTELIRQLVRASGSVGANYREANDALSKKDFGYRIRITRKEAKEAHFWLQLMSETLASPDVELPRLLAEALELRNIFSAIAKKC